MSPGTGLHLRGPVPGGTAALLRVDEEAGAFPYGMEHGAARPAIGSFKNSMCGEVCTVVKIFVSCGSICTTAFGVWHFFVPAQWDWYSYIASQATELVLAVRAINVFFSLCLVLIGIATMLFVYFSPARFSMTVMLALSSILWLVRCLFQIIYPQGSANPLVQYGMLSAFILIFACFFASLLLVVIKQPLIKSQL